MYGCGGEGFCGSSIPGAGCSSRTELDHREDLPRAHRIPFLFHKRPSRWPSRGAAALSVPSSDLTSRSLRRLRFNCHELISLQTRRTAQIRYVSVELSIGIRRFRLKRYPFGCTVCLSSRGGFHDQWSQSYAEQNRKHRCCAKVARFFHIYIRLSRFYA